MGKKAKAAERRRSGVANGEAELRTHLTTYLGFALFFFALDVATGLDDWWFFWPVFFWGLALVFHAVSVYGAAAPARLLRLLRTMIPGGAAESRADGGGRGSRPSADEPVDVAAGRAAGTAAAVDDAEARVARLWRVARRLPAESVREQAFRVCAAADQVAEVLAQDKDRIEPETVGWFVDRLLAPTEALLERYARLASRGVDTAEPTLAKVARVDLPLIESRLDALYQQLHRGDVVDLAVASEMLEFGLDDAPPLPSRSRAATTIEGRGSS